jgi:hypothetical protein
MRYPLLFAVAMAFASSGASGCRTSCDDAVGSTPEPFEGGRTDATGTVYESAPFAGPLLKLPPQKVYRFTHHLRAAPVAVVPYVSFDEDGKEFAVGAGDLAPVSDVNDTSFRVTNNTCETFYLRVAAYTGDFAPAEGDGGAGGAP